MSDKSDRRFFNHFAVIIILLHAVMVGLFVLSRVVYQHTQQDYVHDDALTREAIAERVEPYARVAVAGQDNSALEMEEAPAEQQAVLELGGQETYATACQVCHATGVSGAPRFGNAADWKARLAKGRKTLYQHAIQGFQGEKGVMPPKGGRTDLSDESVMKAVDYMTSEAG
jgi:cytochrome c5